jgi:hypothetical protein
MPTPASPAQSSAKAQQELFLLSSSLHRFLFTQFSRFPFWLLSPATLVLLAIRFKRFGGRIPVLKRVQLRVATVNLDRISSI